MIRRLFWLGNSFVFNFKWLHDWMPTAIAIGTNSACTSRCMLSDRLRIVGESSVVAGWFQWIPCCNSSMPYFLIEQWCFFIGDTGQRSIVTVHDGVAAINKSTKHLLVTLKHHSRLILWDSGHHLRSQVWREHCLSYRFSFIERWASLSRLQVLVQCSTGN